jgi:hypothetical protein
MPMVSAEKGGVMDGWHFTHGPHGWEWHRTAGGGNLKSSARAFASLLECLNDAKTHGYSLILASGACTSHAPRQY